jgi:hypothetical protein
MELEVPKFPQVRLGLEGEGKPSPCPKRISLCMCLQALIKRADFVIKFANRAWLQTYSGNAKRSRSCHFHRCRLEMPSTQSRSLLSLVVYVGQTQLWYCSNFQMRVRCRARRGHKGSLMFSADLLIL